MNIELRHFRLVKAIVEKGSLIEASATLHQTPSALSYQLKEAERQLNIPLFRRMGNKLVITSFGKTFLKSAEVILAELKLLGLQVKEHIGGQTTEIRITTQCHTSYYWLPAVLKRFKQRYPNVKISISYDSTGQGLPLLLQGDLDMMIGYTPNKDKRFREVELFRDEMMVIMADDHPLSSKPYIAADDFTQLTLITHASTLETTNIYEELLKRKGLIPGELIHIPFTEAGISLVKAGIGIMVLPKWMLKPYYNEQELILKPITSKGIYRSQILTVLKSSVFPDHYDCFISYLKDELFQQ